MKNKKVITTLFVVTISAVCVNSIFAQDINLDKKQIDQSSIIKLLENKIQPKQDKTQYRVIKNISELLENKWLYSVDLSLLDLRDYENLFVGKIDFNSKNIIEQWSDNVIWPEKSKMPKSFNPQALLENSKKPESVAKLHEKGITGKGIKIAIIDQRLFKEHPEYKDRVKYYEVFGDNWEGDGRNGVDYHGSLVTGVAAGKNTGAAPSSDIYYFAANHWPDNYGQDESQSLTMFTINKVIRKIIEMNKTFPENEKIRFLSCSWGRANDTLAEEREKLFEEAEQNGIMVLGGYYKHTMLNNSFDKRYGLDGWGLGIPTDGKTNPYYLGGYAYDRLGGNSSTYPYLAGVFAMALQDNQNFTQLPNWQDKLMEIAYYTAINSVVNPAGIVEEVSHIAKDLK
jgi:subtilisin family serine protease